MWLETGELVKLVELLDGAESQLGAYFGNGAEAGSDDPINKCAALLREMRKRLYADIAAADAPTELSAPKGREYKL